MSNFLLLIAIIIFISVCLDNASSRFGVPVLLAFIALGMLFGNMGINQVALADYSNVERMCSAALVFIMFYGGFGTNWKTAKGVAVEASLLATLGVILTAAFTGLFCHYVLGWEWVTSLMLGAVVSSTDAASVFSILRTRKLGLKNGTAPLLEIESGSNDPCSNLLTLVMIAVAGGTASAGKVAGMFLAQILIGLACGFAIATFAIWGIRKVGMNTSGFSSLFTLAIALFSYALPDLLGGNGYLSAYIVGIVMGNAKFQGKKELVHFFDGLTSLMQVLIFFTLGLLAHPGNLAHVVLPAVGIFFFMLLVARPATIALILTPFRKYGFKQQTLISFAGLRGASSIVFAIVATVGAGVMQHDIFNTVFCIVLLSIFIQGFFLPLVAKKLDQIDESDNVMETFTDYAQDSDIQFSSIILNERNVWVGKYIKEIGLPSNILLCQIRKATTGEYQVPKGDTLLENGDEVIFCTLAYGGASRIKLVEVPLTERSKYDGCKVMDYPFKQGQQLLLIRRGEKNIIPGGQTVLKAGDIMIVSRIRESLQEAA